MGKAGRPKKVLTAKQVDELEKLAAHMTLEQIGDFFGMHEATVRRRMREDPKILQAWKRGRARAIALVANGIFRKALDGDTTAGIFWLKSQANWRDRDPPAHIYRDVGEDSPEILAAEARLLLQAMVEADRGIGLEEAEVLSITTEPAYEVAQ